jgi:hypothetical protein
MLQKIKGPNRRHSNLVLKTIAFLYTTNITFVVENLLFVIGIRIRYSSLLFFYLILLTILLQIKSFHLRFLPPFSHGGKSR